MITKNVLLCHHAEAAQSDELYLFKRMQFSLSADILKYSVASIQTAPLSETSNSVRKIMEIEHVSEMKCSFDL
jgi:hypothetical protein